MPKIEALAGNQLKWSPIKDVGNDWDLHEFRRKKANMWMALMLPTWEDVDRGWAKFLEIVFGERAQQEGYERWGIKQTSWSYEDVVFIRKSWPRAKIIYLVRRFENVYQSGLGMSCYQTQRNREENASLFCRQWIALCQIAMWDASNTYDDSCRLVTYENLLLEKEMSKLLEWLNLGNPDPKQYKEKIGASHYVPLTEIDKRVIAQNRIAIEAVSLALGYRDTPTTLEKWQR